MMLMEPTVRDIRDDDDSLTQIGGRLQNLEAQVSALVAVLRQQSNATQRRAPYLIANQMRRVRNQRQQSLGKLYGNQIVWEMVLELYIQSCEMRKIDVTSLCLASGAPVTTALRWVHRLILAGIVVSHDDPGDKRRTFVELSAAAFTDVSNFLHRLADE